jgi:cytochrome c biogenesis protein CcdA
VLTTSFAILAAVGLLTPGFVIAELSVARSARSSRSDLELALRAVAYALAVHLVFGFWTVHVASTVGPLSEWTDHWIELTAYVAVVLLGVPVVLGTLLNRYLAHAELRDGPPSRVAAGLGAGEARDAFDYAFQRRRATGAWVIVELAGHTTAEPRLVGGVYGERSAIGQTPAAHDVYLESLCTVDEDASGVRKIVARLEPERGIYLPAEQIARIELLGESSPPDELPS